MAQKPKQAKPKQAKPKTVVLAPPAVKIESVVRFVEYDDRSIGVNSINASVFELRRDGDKVRILAPCGDESESSIADLKLVLAAVENNE